MTADATIAVEFEYAFVVEESAGPTRLDAWLAGRSEIAGVGLSRSRLQSLTTEGYITVNGGAARPAQRVRPGDAIKVCVPPARAPEDLIPQDIPITVAYEDCEVVVVDKPAGLPVHPGPGHPDGTLVNALLARCPDIRGIGGELRPGIVHRLDRDTSGLLVVAKTQLAHQNLTEQMMRRETMKEYAALSVGLVTPEAGTIDAPIGRDPRHRQRMAVNLGGREARTHYGTVEILSGHTLLAVRLETGRTHQIRVHMSYLGYPVFGDEVYGAASPLLDRQFLHAARLGFRHPSTGIWMEHRAALPPELETVIDTIRNGGAL